MEEIIEAPVNLISFHRPAPIILENDLKFPGLTNVIQKNFSMTVNTVLIPDFFGVITLYELITSQNMTAFRF